MSSLPVFQNSTGQPVAEVLTAETVMRLAANELAAIHVKGFYPVDVAARVAGAIINHPQLGYYTKQYTSTVGRVCMPHIDSEWNEELARKYHSESVANIHGLREIFYPHLSPVDHLRLLLQELWPKGADIQRLHGRTCFVGAFRIFRPEKSFFLPHHDRLEEETDAPEIQGLVQQLVANIYLQVAGKGGDLQLWLREATSSENTSIRDVEGLLLENVEKPRLTIHPEAGDLIIFSSRQLHAVTPPIGTTRVGMAAFIGCYGRGRPLTYWS
jgi:2OG-Fe(II) oxygenase superfamily